MTATHHMRCPWARTILLQYNKENVRYTRLIRGEHNWPHFLQCAPTWMQPIASRHFRAYLHFAIFECKRVDRSNFSASDRIQNGRRRADALAAMKCRISAATKRDRLLSQEDWRKWYAAYCSTGWAPWMLSVPALRNVSP